MKKFLPLLLALNFLCIAAGAQKNKFPDVSAKDFEAKAYAIDSNAQAVVLYDGGSAKYVPNNDGWFNVVYTYRKRMRLLNKNAFDAATVQIPLYKGTTIEDHVSNLDAVTYNLENGVVVPTKLEKSNIFTDKASKYVSIQKFTFPNIKEGSVIDYVYTVVSPISENLRPWYFQGNYPVLKCDYEVAVPTLFNYAFTKKGYYNLDPVSVATENENFNIYEHDATGSRMVRYYADIVVSKWSLSNLPALKKESYTTTLENHISKIEFQLRSLDFPDGQSQPRVRSWPEMIEELLKEGQFGEGLSQNNNWLNTDMESLKVQGDNVATAKNIYHYVANNFACTDDEGIYMSSNLKSAFKAKKGNVAEVNLLLTAMLKQAGIDAAPIILSTRDNGVAPVLYPLMNRYNYVIARAMINNTEYLLDATQKQMGFNHLPLKVYNGYGRLITAQSPVVALSPDSLKETKRTSIFISNDSASKKMFGSFESKLGYYESVDLRSAIAASGEEEYMRKLKANYSGDMTLSNIAFDDLKDREVPATLRYEMTFGMDEDLVYFSPLFGESYKTNPFTAAERNYPVEMPYTTSETIVINMEIPKGYKVEEAPKSVRVNLNDTEGLFEYLVSVDGERVQIVSKLKINKADFEPEDYQTLRDFYSQVVKKQSEQIVFKKK